MQWEEDRRHFVIMYIVSPVSTGCNVDNAMKKMQSTPEDCPVHTVAKSKGKQLETPQQKRALKQNVH